MKDILKVFMCVWLAIATMLVLGFLSSRTHETKECGSFTELAYREGRYPTRCTRESWRFEEIAEDYIDSVEVMYGSL